MARLQTIEIQDKNNLPVKVNAEYYGRTAYSTWVLATGLASYDFFNNVEATSLRNYNKGQNIFEQNLGRVLALQAYLLDGTYAAPQWTLAIASAWDAVRHRTTFIISQDGSISDSFVLSDISPQPPIVVGTVAVANYDGGSAPVKPSGKRAKYYEPPLFVANGRTIDFKAVINGGGGIPAALNGFHIQLVAYIEELPQSNLQMVRQ